MKYPLKIEYTAARCEQCGYAFTADLTFKSDAQASAPTKCPRCEFRFEIQRKTVENEVKNKTEAKLKEEQVDPSNWQLDCLRCKTRMRYIDTKHLLHDTKERRFDSFVLGDFQHFFEKTLNLCMFKCPKCHKVEFFMPPQLWTKSGKK